MKSLLLLSLLLCPLSALAAPIAVRVVDEAGSPIEGATVEVNRFDAVKPPFIVETTDAQGFAKYELGAASFNADFFGQVIAWKAGRALGGGYLMGLKDGTLTLKLGAATAISGTIEDTAGPVEGATIQIKQATVKQESGSNQLLQIGADSALAQKLGARSDATGQFTLQGVPAETHLELRVSGENYATQTVRAQSGGAVKVNLRPGAALSGQVVGLDGAPLAGLLAYVQDKDGEREADSSTDANGIYRFVGLEAGTYNVLFRPALADGFAVAAREGAVAVAGEAHQLETARAVAGVVVRGRVIDAQTQTGIAGIGVSVYGPAQPRSSGVVAPIATDKDGNFSARVVPGANLFFVRDVPRQWNRPPQKYELDIDAGAETKPLIFELTTAVPLRGRFVDENGKGVQTHLVLKQEQREWPLEPDVNGDFKVYTDMKGAVTLGRSMFAGDNEEQSQTPWEIVRGGTLTLPSTEPVQIVVRRAPVGALSGTVADEKGAPIEGVKLDVSVANGEGIGSTSQWKTVLSDAQGRFNLPNIRADQTVKLRGVEKTGYDLQSGGEISQNGINWSVQTMEMRARRNQLSGRVTLANGQSAANAQVFAAGSETRADEKGAYVLQVLPAGNVDVFVYADQQFGFRSAQTGAAGNAATATDFKLAPQLLQPTDRELAGEMLARARVLAAQTQAGDVGRLKLRDADPVASLEALIAAPINDDQMSFAIYMRAGNPDVSTETLLRAVRVIKDSRWRLYAATMLFAKRPDWPDDDQTRELAASLIGDADAIAAAEKPDNQWASSIGLMGVAPLIEKYQGEAAGRAALTRAIAWVKTQFPQPGDGNLGGYLSMLAINAESIAATSPPLFAQLLDEIDKSSPAYTRSLQQGIVAIAKARGLEAAAPFLRQLSAAPTSRDEDGPGNSTNYAARPATREAIEAGGATAPALALELARGLGTNNNDGIENEGARALAEAAFFQSPAVAAALWKEALPQLDADRAAQIAVRVAATQPELGRELLELARQKLDSSDAVNSWGNSVAASFAFYEARFDAAAARYRLEKAWQKAAGQTDDFQMRPDLVRAMSAIDGERAFEWASLLPAGDKQYGDARARALSEAARYIEASEHSRARVDFERWKRDETVFMD